MTAWLRDLREKAGRAAQWREQFGGGWHTDDDLYDDVVLEREECEYVAACSPERVVALCIHVSAGG